MRTKTSGLVETLSVTNPEAMETAIKPVAGNVQFRPVRGTSLKANLKCANLSKTGFLSMDAEAMTASIDPSHNFYGLTISHGLPFNISDKKQSKTFNRNSGHLLLPGEPFNFKSTKGTKVFGTNFFLDSLDDYACQLNNTETFNLPADQAISLETQSGASLVRYLTFIWGELTASGSMLTSDLVAKEVEDGLIAALVYAISDTQNSSAVEKTGRNHSGIKRAEEYLLANLTSPISRTELAQVSGVSIRSLSRAFVKRHGMGPMAYLKKTRLQAAHKELLLSEPEEISVADVALRYGFAQPSKFSAAYKAVYNETPSETLLRI